MLTVMKSFAVKPASTSVGPSISCIAGIIFIIFASAAFYFYRQRNKVSFMTRSPLTIALSLFLLGTDAVLNTLIFSGIQMGDQFHWQCNFGIAGTVIGQFGFVLCTGLRIYRISRVYNHYLQALEVQRHEL